MQLLFLLSFSALVSFFQGDFLVPDLPKMPPPKNADASLGLGVKVRVRVFLQGPYAGAGKMNDNLRTLTGTNGFPTIEPYSSIAGFTHIVGGGESCNTSVLAVTGDNAIVDWVFVELRDKTTPSIIIETRAALLQKDGDVVETDGTNLDIAFSNVTPIGDYHIAVRHKNHLGARTNTAVTLGATSPATTVDFTSLTFPNVYGTNPLKILSDNNVGLYCGNVLQDNTTTPSVIVVNGANVNVLIMDKVSILKYHLGSNDRFPILQAVGGTNILSTIIGYYKEDVNMDGTVKYHLGGNDRFYILQNLGGTNILSTLTEQL